MEIQTTNEKTSNEIRAAIYVRTATQEPGEDKLLSQEECCKQYCSSHGYTLTPSHIYREVLGGAQYHERPVLSALVASAREGAFDVVVVYALDRLSRKQVDVQAIMKELGSSCVSVMSVTEDDAMLAALLVKGVLALAVDIGFRQMLLRHFRQGMQSEQQGE